MRDKDHKSSVMYQVEKLLPLSGLKDSFTEDYQTIGPHCPVTWIGNSSDNWS